VNEVSFRARSHRNAHYTLGVDIGATGPWWRVDSIEGREGGREGGEEKWRDKDTCYGGFCMVTCLCMLIFNLVLLVPIDCFLVFFYIRVCSLHILWH
jgi:hypothetical protein